MKKEIGNNIVESRGWGWWRAVCHTVAIRSKEFAEVDEKNWVKKQKLSNQKKK